MMNRNTLIRLLAGALCLGGLPSCSTLVLEDRSDCPAFLFFDLDNGPLFDPAEPVCVSAFRYPEAVRLACDTATVSALGDRSFCLEVRRSESVYGCGVLGFDGARLEGMSRWVVPEGRDYVPLWRFDYRGGALGESFLFPVEATKEHSRVVVRFMDFDRFSGTDGRFPFRAVVRGNTCGVDALTGVPVQGPFSYAPPEQPGGTFAFTVPRQWDRSLTLELWGTGGLWTDSGMVASFDLWSLFREQEDFSWDARNLLDMEIELWYVEYAFAVTVSPWSGTDSAWVYDF